MLRSRTANFLLAVCVAVGAAAVPGKANAAFTIHFSSANGSQLHFNGDGTFSFDNPAAGVGGTTNPNDRDFQIDAVSGIGTPNSFGLFGNIDGDFAMGAITTTGTPFGQLQQANVTTTGGMLTIFDGANTFTGELDFISIFTLDQGASSSGSINGGGTINLKNVTYSGPRLDLLELADLEGHVALSFTFSPSQNLSTLSTTNVATSYSGTITPTPAPSALLLAGIGVFGLFGGNCLRRRGRGTQAAA